MSASSHWSSTLWHGESAWQSSSAGWTAVVSVDRCRLVSLAPTAGGPNLLFSTSKEGDVSWGGQVCWLGPQNGWLDGWPPPPDWHSTAAERAEVTGDILTLVQKHADSRYPAISRTYRWKNGVLECGVKWRGGRFHSIQILQVPPSAIVHVKRRVSPGLPNGYAVLHSGEKTGDVVTDQPSTTGVLSAHGNGVTLAFSRTADKLGFFPQPIVAEIGEFTLTMSPGKPFAKSDDLPNLGLTTQVWIGNNALPFIELEQLSPWADRTQGEWTVDITPGRRKTGPR